MKGSSYKEVGDEMGPSDTLRKSDLGPTDTLRRNAAANLNMIGAEIQLTAAASGVVPDDTFTVTQAINSIGFGRFQIVLSFVVGVCWMADSMEMMILSILPLALHCEWGINQYSQAFLTTIVFIGMMISSTFWGKLSDRFGRKQALIISGIFLFFYGFLSTFSPSYPWILCLRFMVGFNIGCVPQSVTLYAEFLPTVQRGKCVVLLDCFWALGACLEVVLAMLVMPTLGWRWLLALSSLPSLGFVLACSWLPESPRYMAASGNSDGALATLDRVATENGRSMLLGRLTVDDLSVGPGGGRGRLGDLLAKDLRRTTLSLWLIWATASFSYYGVVLMSAELFQSPQGQLCAMDGQVGVTCSAQCHPLSTGDYNQLLWTTLAEFPGIIFSVLLLERLGRKRTLALEFFLFTITLCFLFSCSSSRATVTAILFCARALGSGLFQVAYVYTPEVYPTVLRSVGVGSCSGIARAGAMLTPYIAQVLMRQSVQGAVAVYACSTLMATACCMFLPLETRGRDMKESRRG